MLLKQYASPGRALPAQAPGLAYIDGPVTMMDRRVDRRCPASPAEPPTRRPEPRRVTGG